MKEKNDIIFVVLTYRNTTDIIKLIDSIEKLKIKFKIIIVNSHYDEDTSDTFSKIAKKYNCDFIDVPNRGYGAGNNRGIAFAREKYVYEFLIVCNPDIVVVKLNNLILYRNQLCIVSPKIIRNDGRNQNPMRLRKSSVCGWLSYYGFKYDQKLLILASIALNKIVNGNARKTNKITEIFSAHGSFVIFSHLAVEKLQPIYDEQMFLFCEEDDLAFKCQQEKVKTIYDPNLAVRHYEDGSMSLATIDLKLPMKNSYLWMWEKWH